MARRSGFNHKPPEQDDRLTGHVLVVDDEELNRSLLRDLLEPAGYTVTGLATAEEALEQVPEVRPDIILLDVLLPGLSGFEVCKSLKADPRTAPIPVLLITGLAERKDRIRGIEAGANDFLIKPIDPEDVVLRVRNALYTKHLFDQVQQNYEKLRDLETLRDNLTYMIVHDLRSPLTGMMGYLDLLRLRASDKLGPDEQEYIAILSHQFSNLLEMINSMLDVNKLESGEMPLNRSRCDLGMVIHEAIGMLGALVGEKRVVFETPSNGISGVYDVELIRRVVVNLLANANQHAPRTSEIRISMEKLPGHVKISVSDKGPGIPPDYQDRIFEKFGQVDIRQHDRKYSTGLGLTFCKLVVEAHQGTIGVESRVREGSTFWFTLPLDASAD